MQKLKNLFYGLSIISSLSSSAVFGSETPMLGSETEIPAKADFLCAEQAGVYLVHQGKKQTLKPETVIDLVALLEKNQGKPVPCDVHIDGKPQSIPVRMNVVYNDDPRHKNAILAKYQEYLLAFQQ